MCWDGALADSPGDINLEEPTPTRRSMQVLVSLALAASAANDLPPHVHLPPRCAVSKLRLRCVVVRKQQTARRRVGIVVISQRGRLPTGDQPEDCCPASELARERLQNDWYIKSLRDSYRPASQLWSASTTTLSKSPYLPSGPVSPPSSSLVRLQVQALTGPRKVHIRLAKHLKVRICHHDGATTAPIRIALPAYATADLTRNRAPLDKTTFHSLTSTITVFFHYLQPSSPSTSA